VLANEVWNVFRVDRRQPSVTFLATFDGNQSSSALTTQSRPSLSNSLSNLQTAQF
jgi:hypothetical protein